MSDVGGARSAGAAQGLTITASAMAPILTVVALPAALPSMMAAFRDTPNTELWIPLLVTLPGLAAALLSPAVGWLTDRVGRRRPLLLGLVLYIVFGMAPFFLNDLLLIVVSRFALGIGLTLVVVSTSALLADYFDENRRRTWLTAQGMAIPLMAAAFLTTGGLLSKEDWHFTFLIYAICVPLLVAAFLFCYGPARTSVTSAQNHTTTPFPWMAASWVWVIAAIVGVFFYAFVVFGGLTFAEVQLTDPAQVGAILGAVSLATIISAIAFNVLSRRVAPEWLFVLQFVVMGVGLVGIGLSESVPVMIVFSVVHQLGAGMMVPATMFWMAMVLPPEHRGRGFGIFVTMSFVGQFFVPLIVAFMSGAAGGLLPAFVALGAISAICGLVVAGARFAKRGSAAAQA